MVYEPREVRVRVEDHLEDLGISRDFVRLDLIFVGIDREWE